MKSAFRAVEKTNTVGLLIGTTAGTAVLRLAGNMVLTRLLLPEAFGIMLLLNTVLFVLKMTTETGIAPYVVRQDDGADRPVLNVLWTLQTIRGTFIAAIILLAAPLFTSLMGQPEATTALRWVALAVFVENLRSLAPFVKRRNRQEQRYITLEFIAYIIQLAITITAVVILETYWGLVIGLISFPIIKTLFTYIFFENSLHRFAYNHEIAKKLWSFAKYILGSSILTIIVLQFDRFIVLRNFDLSIAGQYGLAVSLLMIFETLTKNFSSRSYFPEVSNRLRKESPSPTNYYGPMRLVQPALCFAAAGGIAFGETLFTILYSEQYALAGVFFSILVLRSLMGVTTKCAQVYLVAAGQMRTQFFGNVARVVWLFGVATTAFHYYGRDGLLIALALTELPAFLLFYARLLQLKVLRVTGELRMLGASAAGLGAGWLANLAVTQLFGLS